MALEEAFDLPGPLALEERADGVHETAARLDQLSGNAEQPLLHRNDAVEPLRREAPASFGIAAPRAGSRARRVDQDEVGRIAPFTEPVQLMRRVQQQRLDASAGLLGTRPELRQSPAIAVRRQDFSRRCGGSESQ